jgi:hypothetical protein
VGSRPAQITPASASRASSASPRPSSA